MEVTRLRNHLTLMRMKFCTDKIDAELGIKTMLFDNNMSVCQG